MAAPELAWGTAAADLGDAKAALREPLWAMRPDDAASEEPEPEQTPEVPDAVAPRRAPHGTAACPRPTDFDWAPAAAPGDLIAGLLLGRPKRAEAPPRRARSVTPQPKKMPRRRPPDAAPAALSDSGAARGEASSAGEAQGRPGAEAERRKLTATAKWASPAGPPLLPPSRPKVCPPPRPTAAPFVPRAPARPPLGATEAQAAKILARHAARIGGAAGSQLESAVCAAALVGPGAERAATPRGCWAFLDSGALGWERYLRFRWEFEEMYKAHGRASQGDAAVLAAIEDCRNLHALPPPPLRRPPQQLGPQAVLELPIADVRFAHNDQSERFGGFRGAENRSVLTTAVELVSGQTAIEALPRFDVCWHDGAWYCRTGNRRLAAMRLAQDFAPDRLALVCPRPVPVDEIFTHGRPGKAPKLTTHWNGDSCRGQWIVIRETGEVVGSRARGRGAYGADLLSLLPCVAIAACGG